MYYLLILVLVTILITNPEKISETLPGLNEMERDQLKRGLLNIRQGISDTTNSAVNALLRKIMGESDDN